MTTIRGTWCWVRGVAKAAAFCQDGQHPGRDSLINGGRDRVYYRAHHVADHCQGVSKR